MIRGRMSVNEVIVSQNTNSEYRQGRMSKPYWRSATFRNWLVALLILAALTAAPMAAARLPSDRFIGLPSTLVFFAVGMPLIFLILAIFKISLQQGLDRNHELDTEDQLQRRRVPKRLKSFPVRAVDVDEPDLPETSDNAEASGDQSDGDTQQLRKVSAMRPANRKQVAG